MLCNILPRMLVIAILFALHTLLGIIPLVAIFIILVIAAFNDWKIQRKQTVLLALFTSLFCPCLIIDDYSTYFLRNGLLVNVLYLFLIWMVYFFTKFDLVNFAFSIKAKRKNFADNTTTLISPRKTTTFQCFYADDLDIKHTLRCVKNPTPTLK